MDNHNVRNPIIVVNFDILLEPQLYWPIQKAEEP